MTDRFRAAARAYFVYGIVYWLGGAWLIFQGVGVAGAEVRGKLSTLFHSVWVLVGLVIIFLVPFLLRHPRAWFDRWILSRRDFARVLALLLAFRAYKVGAVAVRSGGGAVAAPWGGTVTFQAGAVVFFLVTLAALWFVVRAAWGAEAEGRA